MSKLFEYVLVHSARNACTCGKCITNGENTPMTGHTVDVFFFDVCAKDGPEVDEFKELIAAHKGEWADMNPLDGQEHNYMEVGGWIGDQGLAMQFMGLGEILGLWRVAHPVNMLKLKRDDPMAQQLAGMGMVSIVPKA